MKARIQWRRPGGGLEGWSLGQGLAFGVIALLACLFAANGIGRWLSRPSQPAAQVAVAPVVPAPAPVPVPPKTEPQPPQAKPPPAPVETPPPVVADPPPAEPPKEATAPKPPPRRPLAAGQTVQVSGSAPVLAAADEAALEAMRRAGQSGLRSLIREGKLFTLPGGTRVEVLRVAGGKVKVLALTGPRRGQTGFVEASQLKPL